MNQCKPSFLQSKTFEQFLEEQKELCGDFEKFKEDVLGKPWCCPPPSHVNPEKQFYTIHKSVASGPTVSFTDNVLGISKNLAKASGFSEAYSFDLVTQGIDALSPVKVDRIPLSDIINVNLPPVPSIGYYGIDDMYWTKEKRALQAALFRKLPEEVRDESKTRILV